jgi:alkanesulfonate monooxygenase SsuD/methylene tetrahydromethanopterin reductase-like flavin-dependent oxidoreductase (luciferase family)
MKRIWAGVPIGEETGRPIGPPPARPGGPELLIGGWAPRALARVGRFADGYVGAIVSDAMLSDDAYRLAEASWRDHGRPGRPRFVNNVYFALGPGATEMIEAFVRKSYVGQPELMNDVIAVTPKSESDVRQMLGRLEAIGTDEVIFHTVSSNIEQFDRLEQALG